MKCRHEKTIWFLHKCTALCNDDEYKYKYHFGHCTNTEHCFVSNTRCRREFKGFDGFYHCTRRPVKLSMLFWKSSLSCIDEQHCFRRKR